MDEADTRTDLKSFYDRLPAHEQAEAWKIIAEAMHWRGWHTGVTTPALMSGHGSVVSLEALADLFARNGVEIEDYA